MTNVALPNRNGLLVIHSVQMTRRGVASIEWAIYPDQDTADRDGPPLDGGAVMVANEINTPPAPTFPKSATAQQEPERRQVPQPRKLFDEHFGVDRLAGAGQHPFKAAEEYLLRAKPWQKA